MSDIKKGNLLDQTNLGQFIDEPISILKSIFDYIFEDDEFDGQSNFKAVVISNPVDVLPSEYEALGYTNFNSTVSAVYKKFKVRIVNKKQNPHALLQDPCDITEAADLCQQYALVAAHTTIVAEQNLGLNIGSLVEVHLDKNSNGTYNLQTGHLVKVIYPNSRGKSILTAEECKTIKTYFRYGESYVPPPPIEITSELRELADRYDENDSIPGKNSTNLQMGGRPIMPHMHHLSDYPQGFKKPFDMFVKAMLQAAFEAGYGEIAITSGTRDPAHQEKLHQAFLRGERDLPASCGYCETASKHVVGLAIDINFFDIQGNFINSKSSPAEWLATRLPQMFMKAPFHMKWGGNFKPKDDVVHFELNPANWGKDADQILKQLREENINLDTESTGPYTEAEMEGFDKRRGQDKNESNANNPSVTSDDNGVPSSISEAASAAGPYSSRMAGPDDM